MSINLSNLSTATSTAQSLSNLILVNPQDDAGIQPQNKNTVAGDSQQQPPKFLFDYDGEQSIILESDITDHYVEDNTSIQDQIALRPEIISTHGYIAELNDIVPSILSPLKTVADKLLLVSAFTPELSITALRALNAATQVYATASAVASSAVSAWNTISGNDKAQNKQQKAFQMFYGYWKNRTLFTVQTPWAIFRNMAIKSLRPIQDAETKVISEFEIQFKQIRFADTTFAGVALNDFQGRSAAQAASVTNNGISTPVTSPVSFGSKFGSLIG